ncbi:DUF4115 domain-containing protein [Porticoccaceae bacterium LTM1]|nr:DUF4115 domain-containing protein [Porticoccaceae bacterium LTM1]
MQDNNKQSRETAVEVNKEQIEGERASSTTPGILLRKARRDQGISEEEVCEQLGLGARALRALESDNLEQLPADAYVRGYLRRYSALLGIPCEPVLDSYQHYREEMFGKVEPALSEPVQSIGVPLSKRPNWVKPLFWICLILLLVVVAFWGLRELSGNTEASVVHEDGAKTLESQKPLQKLSLSFTGNTWVEVIDAQQDILLADMAETGELRNLEGVAPFQVKLSDASAVKIHYAGRPVEVESASQARVARVVIGH